MVNVRDDRFAVNLQTLVARLVESAAPRQPASPDVAPPPQADAPKNGSTFSRGGVAPWSGQVSALFGSPLNVPAQVNAATLKVPPPKIGDAKIVDTKTEHRYGPTAWTWNQWLPTNGGSQSPEYTHWRAMNKAADGVGTTYRALESAKAALPKAITARDAAKTAYEPLAKDLVARKKDLDDAKAAKAALPSKATAAEKAQAKDTIDAAKRAYDGALKLEQAGKKKLDLAEQGAKTATDNVPKAQKAYDDAQASVERTSKAFKTYLEGNMSVAHAADPAEKALRKEGARIKADLKAEKDKKPDARKLKALDKEIAGLERSIPKADAAAQPALNTKLAAKKKERDDEKLIAPDPARVQSLETQATANKTALDNRKAALETEIRAYQPVQGYDQTITTVEVDGQRITVRDHMQAYSTERAGALTGSGPDDAATVTAAVDGTSLNADDKAIMKGISHFEGHFSTTENGDIGGITWGMIQWTSGMDGRGSMMDVLNKVKADDPATFKKRFQDYGIDVKAGTLTVTKPNGDVVSGADAVNYVRTDPKLTAVLIRAAGDPDVQGAQVEIAKPQKIDREGLDRTAQISVGGKSYRFSARDVMTSEWGAALVANASVHSGPGEVSRRLKDGLEAYFKAHPTADPTKPATWLADAEATVARHMIGGDQNRADYFENTLKMSKVAGTYGH